MDRLVPSGIGITPSWIDDMGTFNNLPRPSTEVEEAVFQDIFRAHSPEFLEFRQIQLPNEENEGIKDVHIFYFSDTAIAMVHPEGKHGTRYFRIGCHHQWRQMTKNELRERSVVFGRCIHASVCSKCGSENVVDSSD